MKFFKIVLFALIDVISASIIDIPAQKPVYIALTQPDSSIMYNILNDLSNPLSKNYSKWLSKVEIDRLVLSTSDKEANKNILQWLNNNDITQIYNFGDSIKFFSSQDKINKLFNIRQHIYYIPTHLRRYVDFVEMERGHIPRTYKINYKTKDATVDDRYFGRESFMRLYNLSNVTLDHSVSAGAVEYQNNDGFTNSDLNKQQYSNKQTINNITHIVGNNVGTNDESELDVQVMSQVADNIDLWYWQTSLWLYSMAVDFNNANDVPQVLSMSWGWSENAQCDIIQCVNITSYDYIRRVNYEYMKILLRGTTIVASSGDAGAPGRTSEDCNVKRPVNAIFPGSSEFVISVGATFVETTRANSTAITPLCANHSCVEGTVEHVVNFENVSWTSGGGFSNFTEKTPYWQENEVKEYLKKTPSLPNATTFNSNGRAYPDISLVGHSCPTYNQGILEGLDGTSCSSPLMGGVVAVINRHQLTKGRNVVGYLNPLLYHISENCKECFHDISGGNNWCTEGGCCENPTQYGYQGIEGFDPVTGLGTPNIGNILNYLDSLFDNKI